MCIQPSRWSADGQVPGHGPPQRNNRSDNISGPKPSSVLFKSPPSKLSTTNQGAGDGSHVDQGAVSQIVVYNAARTPSGDSEPKLSSSNNVYQDSSISNGALTTTTPYPREV